MKVSLLLNKFSHGNQVLKNSIGPKIGILRKLQHKRTKNVEI